MTVLDPFAVQFWWVVAAAVVVLIPLRGPWARKWALSGINLGFLALAMRSGVVPVLILATVAWAVLRACAGRFGSVAMAVGGVGTLAMFLENKLPSLGASAGLGPINPILATIGASYVALRLVDAGRAVREGRRPPPDLPSTINYLLPFHMLAAGPIQAYEEFADQPAVPDPPTRLEATRGFERIAAGMFKKYVLAQGLQRLFLTGFHAQGPYQLLEMQLNYLWLYLDFSAYSDIAVGIGRLIGVPAPENFNRPYLARNMIEFWERWHISLSQFIRRNLFIPIQMNLMRRTGGARPLLISSFAFTVSFLLCGLWHSIGWVWAAWGLFQAAGLIACSLYRHILIKRLGRKGYNRYMADPRIRLVAIAVTFEFAAFAVAIVTYPFQEISWMPTYRP
jgi:D-alanyl-lipoteichoic acid acyltransferase DltB (MBOAT superfamily)